jgi:hypothetical protein
MPWDTRIYGNSTIILDSLAFMGTCGLIGINSNAFMPDYPLLMADVQRRIIEGVWHSSELAAAVGKPEIVIVHILHWLQADNFVSVATDSGGTSVFEVKPKLKRLFGQS